MVLYIALTSCILRIAYSIVYINCVPFPAPSRNYGLAALGLALYVFFFDSFDILCYCLLNFPSQHTLYRFIYSMPLAYIDMYCYVNKYIREKVSIDMVTVSLAYLYVYAKKWWSRHQPPPKYKEILANIVHSTHIWVRAHQCSCCQCIFSVCSLCWLLLKHIHFIRRSLLIHSRCL